MAQVQEQYVVDAEGNPVAVILDIKVYQRLLEALEELEAIQAYDEAKASGEQPIPLEEALHALEERRP
jgi:PHD/YefM family antitoxin component YafN of YafNO toxin-antitoxin module